MLSDLIANVPYILGAIGVIFFMIRILYDFHSPSLLGFILSVGSLLFFVVIGQPFNQSYEKNISKPLDSENVIYADSPEKVIDETKEESVRIVTKVRDEIVETATEFASWVVKSPKIKERN